jgi:L-methionine (R)-S-oxide reductase
MTLFMEIKKKQIYIYIKILNMEKTKKTGRYTRLYKQLEELTAKCENPLSRMATICAVLHHKMEYFFWTGFYLLNDGKLQVGPYQGPVACQELSKDKGVCWASINRMETIVVPDVHDFPGHIACDSRSNSEIVVLLKNGNGEIVGVLDVDSKDLQSFDETDALELEKIVGLVYSSK